MEHLLLYLAGSFIRRKAAPAFDRFYIGGCSSLLLNHQTTVHTKLTKDGERVYFYEADLNGVTYGLITVKMKHFYPSPQAKDLLIHYLQRIRKPFGIACRLPTETAHRPGVVELTDYWQDEAGADWKVKSFCNGRTMAVLYVKNIGRARVNEQEAYLNGFRFSSAG